MNEKYKSELLDFFRDNTEKYMEDFLPKVSDYKKRADLVNKYIKKLKDVKLAEISQISDDDSWKKSRLLESILLINYVSYVVMLEYRNKVWSYDYMAFSRRIGELWEPFCKLPFEYPVNKLELYEPPLFDDVKGNLQTDINDFISDLKITEHERDQLREYLSMVWGLVESGGIQLGLDLHFKMDNIHYDVDYKSGFSSNEKGNTNRLLLVGSIYNSLPEEHKTLIFVRQQEEENNHYLQTLKNSPYWNVYCADEAYEQIKQFSGFNLKHWMNENMNWEHDISNEFRNFLETNGLLKYLTW